MSVPYNMSPPAGPVSYTGAELVAWLRSGWEPASIQTPFPLQADERCVGVVDSVLEGWLASDGSYMHKSVGWAGGLGGLALGAATSAIGNARRRAKAAREAAERWRVIDRPRVFMTSRRLALQGSEWMDVWYSGIRVVNQDHSGLIVQSAGGPAIRLQVHSPDYWYVLLRHYAYNDVVSN